MHDAVVVEVANPECCVERQLGHPSLAGKSAPSQCLQYIAPWHVFGDLQHHTWGRWCDHMLAYMLSNMEHLSHHTYQAIPNATDVYKTKQAEDVAMRTDG